MQIRIHQVSETAWCVTVSEGIRYRFLGLFTDRASAEVARARLDKDNKCQHVVVTTYP
jgi:hypothetical protein